MIITNETIKCIKSFLPDEDCYSCSSCMYYTESDCSMAFGKCYLQQAFDLLNQLNEMLKKEVVEIDIAENSKDNFVNNKVASIDFYFKDELSDLYEDRMSLSGLKDKDIILGDYEDPNVEVALKSLEKFKKKLSAEKEYKKQLSVETGDGLVVVDYTCNHCADKKNCPYAYDDYCTDGDCLAMK